MPETNNHAIPGKPATSELDKKLEAIREQQESGTAPIYAPLPQEETKEALDKELEDDDQLLLLKLRMLLAEDKDCVFGGCAFRECPKVLAYIKKLEESL